MNRWIKDSVNQWNSEFTNDISMNRWFLIFIDDSTVARIDQWLQWSDEWPEKGYLRDSIVMGDPQNGWFKWKMPLKWMMTWGTPIYGTSTWMFILLIFLEPRCSDAAVATIMQGIVGNLRRIKHMPQTMRVIVSVVNQRGLLCSMFGTPNLVHFDFCHLYHAKGTWLELGPWVHNKDPSGSTGRQEAWCSWMYCQTVSRSQYASGLIFNLLRTSELLAA